MSDDLRVRAARVWAGESWDNLTEYQRHVLLLDADRAIAIVWNEAYQCGLDRASDVIDAFLESRLHDIDANARADISDSDLAELVDNIRALRKPEEGG